MRKDLKDRSITSTELRGRLALVTGASSGIGRALCLLLAGRGADVLAVARGGEKLAALCNEIHETTHTQARFFIADLAAPSGLEALLKHLDGEARPVDILVNDAGVTTYGFSCDIPEEDELRLIHLNCIAPYRLIRHCLPAMCDRRFGRILNVASVSGLMPVPFFANYAASKAFLVGLSESLHYEMLNTPVTVSCLLPGVTRTPFWSAERLKDKIEPRRFGQFDSPELVARHGLGLILSGKPFHIVGWKNRVKQFLLRRVFPRSVTGRMLRKHCFSPVLLRKTQPENYLEHWQDFRVHIETAQGREVLPLPSLLPNGLCPLLLHNALPYYLTLKNGGRFPWMPEREKDSVLMQCPNPGGGVEMKVVRTAAPAGIGGRIVAVRGRCPLNQQPGAEVDLSEIEGRLSLGEMNALLPWVLILSRKGGSAASPILSVFRADDPSRRTLRLCLGETAESEAGAPCPDLPPFTLRLSYFTHRCRYHKWPRREVYTDQTWLPQGLCPELFHQAYPHCLAALYGDEKVRASVGCPHRSCVEVEIRTRRPRTYGLRKGLQNAIGWLGMNTEIPLLGLELRVTSVQGDCPWRLREGQVFPFNTMRLPSLCPACFHSIYPGLRAGKGRAPWSPADPNGSCLQCPDCVSNTTFAVDAGGQENPR